MLASIAHAFGQLPDPRFRSVLLRSLAITLVLYILLYVAVGFGLRQLHLFQSAWIDTGLDLLGGAGVFVISILLFPAVTTLALSFFLEDVAQAVEARHFPNLGQPRPQGWMELIWGAVRFAGVVLLVNLLALPIYLPLLFFGVGALVYYGINGYLISREYFEMVASRRLEPDRADALRRAHLGRLWVLGAALAFWSSLPFLNLLTPILGTAAMLHEFEALRRHHGIV